MLVEFASAVDAVRGAVEVQRGMAEQNAAVPQDTGSNFASASTSATSSSMTTISSAMASISPLALKGIAEPGGVCISDDAHRQIRGKVEFVFDDMGPQTLKNIAEPMRAWRVQAR